MRLKNDFFHTKTIVYYGKGGLLLTNSYSFCFILNS